MKDLTLNTLATLRLIRLVTTDDLGGWFIVDPANRWAERHDGASADYLDRWRHRLVSGLDCPHCISVWLGAAVLAADHLTYGTRARGPFTALRAALALSTVTGHVAARID